MARENIALPKSIGALGTRKARDMNVAFLGKVVWELHC